ncbi:MAG: hypothetical protein LUE13_07610, partial [Akkermansiaceae bacterium]|nr:hypothetical protein [Akkermansiaceae bacterium]
LNRKEARRLQKKRTVSLDPSRKKFQNVCASIYDNSVNRGIRDSLKFASGAPLAVLARMVEAKNKEPPLREFLVFSMAATYHFRISRHHRRAETAADN